MIAFGGYERTEKSLLCFFTFLEKKFKIYVTTYQGLVFRQHLLCQLSFCLPVYTEENIGKNVKNRFSSTEQKLKDSYIVIYIRCYELE